MNLETGLKALSKELLTIKEIKFVDSINNISRAGKNIDAILFDIGGVSDTVKQENKKQIHYREIIFYHLGETRKNDFTFLQIEEEILRKILDTNNWAGAIQDVEYIASQTSSNQRPSELNSEVSTGQNNNRFIHSYTVRIQYCFQII